MKNRNDIITKKCMDCNTNQAKYKGGLCKGCYKKQGCDSMKYFCVLCYENGKEITANWDGCVSKEGLR